MNDLIDSNGSRGKVAHFEKLSNDMHIVWIVKHHVITEPKKQISANYGRFLSKFFQTLTLSEHAHEFRSDWPLLTLSNRCLKCWPMAAMFFWDMQMYLYFVPLRTEICIPNFKLIGPTV